MGSSWQLIKGTEYIKFDDASQRKKAISSAARIIRGGGLLAFPTETVYGLGADALNPDAVLKIYAAKERPVDNPLIVHIASLDQLNPLVDALTSEAERLASAFWPGPLTLVLRSSKIIPPVVTAGLDTVAVRIPDHPLALELLRVVQSPVAAPSANRSGSPSPTTTGHVFDDLAGKIDAVFEGGTCRVGVESTVVDLTGSVPVILRPGGVTREALSSCLGAEIEVASGLPGNTEAVSPPSPGMKYRHYAPDTPMVLVTGDPEAIKEKTVALCRKYHSDGKKVGVLTFEEHLHFYRAGSAGVAGAAGVADTVQSLGSRNLPELVARELYSGLRFLDRPGVDIIIAEGFTENGIGLALMDRLRKAAGNNIV